HRQDRDPSPHGDPPQEIVRTRNIYYGPVASVQRYPDGMARQSAVEGQALPRVDPEAQPSTEPRAHPPRQVSSRPQASGSARAAGQGSGPAPADVQDWRPDPDRHLSLLFDVFALGQRTRTLLVTAMRGCGIRPDEYAAYSVVFEAESITMTEV